jgi:hypothetical protein
MRRRRYRRRNPATMSVQAPKRGGSKDDKRDIAIAVGVVAVAGLGYYLYTQYGSGAGTTASTTGGGGSAGGGTLSSGQQSYSLPSSTTSGMPAASASGDSDT